jgi:hypothetical protein
MRTFFLASLLLLFQAGRAEFDTEKLSLHGSTDRNAVEYAAGQDEKIVNKHPGATFGGADLHTCEEGRLSPTIGNLACINRDGTLRGGHDVINHFIGSAISQKVII